MKLLFFLRYAVIHITVWSTLYAKAESVDRRTGHNYAESKIRSGGGGERPTGELLSQLEMSTCPLLVICY